MTLRVLRSGAAGAILATLLLFVMIAFRPVSAELALDAYLLVLGGIALFALVEAAAETDPDARRSVYEQALEMPDDPGERPPELARVEREVALGVDSAFYEHYRLRPLLREIAGQRLENRFAAELDAPRREARESLPEEAWELLRADRQPPRNRHAPGIPLERLREIVAALEKI
jgi:hypothetical protein